MARYTQPVSGEALQAQPQSPDWCVVDCRFDLLQRVDTEPGTARPWRAGPRNRGRTRALRIPHELNIDPASRK
jgi:hypothetical protein